MGVEDSDISKYITVTFNIIRMHSRAIRRCLHMLIVFNIH